jgi:hypothetical protein
MATVEGARRLQKTGQIIALLGCLVGVILWIVELPRQVFLFGFVLPLLLGSVASLLGMILKRSAKSA